MGVPPSNDHLVRWLSFSVPAQDVWLTSEVKCPLVSAEARPAAVALITTVTSRAIPRVLMWVLIRIPFPSMEGAVPAEAQVPPPRSGGHLWIRAFQRAIKGGGDGA